MATRLAWLLNLDADVELADPNGYTPIDSVRARELAQRCTDLIAPGDSLDTGVGDRAIAFCPTPSALKRMAAWGIATPAAPSLSVLRRVNDRAFCAELGQTMDGASFARDMAEAVAAVATPSPTGVYVLKRAFSFAGRERLRVPHGSLDAHARGFCARSFARGEGVQIEPWVERVCDYAKHGYLTDDALLIGATRTQCCDAVGRYLSMSDEIEIDPATEAALEATLIATADGLTRAGYFGPFGIDAFRYRIGGREDFNPRCEINARFTMGYPRALLELALAE